MKNHLLRFAFVFCLVLGLAAFALPAAPASMALTALAAPAAPPTVKAADIAAARIENAMSAAPQAIAKDATIRDWLPESADPLIVLDKTWVRRQGTNGWTCYADWPASPGNDPQCNNAEAEAWFDALLHGKGAPPKASSLGISYMLMGGSDPSNTDPAAAGPAAGEEWVTSGPHIMLVAPRGFDARSFSTDHMSGAPYIMWDGTPYEHLMVPVSPMPADEMGTVSRSMQSAQSAAPAGVAGSATLLDWLPETADPLMIPFDMIVRRSGANNWTCISDWPASPGNDPSCNDPMWTLWNNAYASGKAPRITVPGIAYMLQGGSDPSNTDPAAGAPAPGEDWVNSPAHLMLLMPGGFDAGHFSTDHMSGYPYIMWDGTPYEHLMMPVADMSS